MSIKIKGYFKKAAPFSYFQSTTYKSMLQNRSFSGQSVFAQLAGLINKASFSHIVKKQQADYYCKRCKSWEHFICMLYCIVKNCTSLREVTHGIAAYEDKLNHLGLTYTPPPSTLSDAKCTRSEKFFGEVYKKLYNNYKASLSDSQTSNELLKRNFYHRQYHYQLTQSYYEVCRS